MNFKVRLLAPYHCLKQLFRKKRALTMADLYPVNLLAYAISLNIPKCMNEAHLQATERFIQSHLAMRYPASVARKYITDLKWQLFFRRIELGLHVRVINS